MKKIVLFILIACLLLVSCNKEGIQEEQLFGKWKLDKVEWEQISYASTMGDTEYYENYFYIFYEEGTVKILDEKDKISEYVYHFDAGNKTLAFSDKEYTVEQLTKSSLVFCNTLYFLDGTAPTQPAKGTSNFHYYLTKVK